MLFINVIGLLIFLSFSLSDMKPAFPKSQKTKPTTKLETLQKTKSDLHQNMTLPAIENDFVPNHEKMASLSPVGLAGHHKLTGVKTKCPESTAETLLSRLGTAFNVRYMSVERPVYMSTKSILQEKGYQQDDPGSDKAREPLDFYVDTDFVRELEETENHRQLVSNRSPAEELIQRIRRSVKSKKRKSSRRLPTSSELPWKCSSRLVWRDLGTNHFPQFLRSVRCLSEHCWFSHFRCLPKSFTVKVLKRKSDDCVPIPSSETAESLYEQHWIFEERAVTFCCECVDR